MQFLIRLLVIMLFFSQLNAMSNSSFGIGYRNDSIKTLSLSPLSGDLESSIKEHDLNSILEVFDMQVFFDKWLLGFTLDYGILVSGNRITENFVPDFPPMEFSAKQDYGYEVDALPKLGYSFYLSKQTACPSRFIVAVGYGYSRISLRTKKQPPLFLENVMPGINEQVFLFDTGSFRYEWFGPFLEGKFDIFLSQFWRCSFAYQYHFLSGKTKQPLFLQMNALDGSSLFFQRDLSTTLRTKISSASKNWGEISLSYLASQNSSLRLEGTLSKCKSHKAKQTAHIQNQTFSAMSPSTFSIDTEENGIKQSWFSTSLILFLDVLF